MVRSAVKELRLALGKTQTEFGDLIGKGIATIQRYESLVPPKGVVLIRLRDLALENKRNDLAELFNAALLEELGTENIGSLGLSKEQAGWLFILQFILQNEQGPRIPQDLYESLRETLTHGANILLTSAEMGEPVVGNPENVRKLLKLARLVKVRKPGKKNALTV